jgi:hypothetical protein
VLRDCASAALKPIAEPNHAALQHLTAFQRHRPERGRRNDIFIAEIEDARRTFRAIHGREDREAELVDEAGAKEEPFALPRPSSSKRFISSSRFRMSSAKPRSRSRLPGNM